MLYLEHLSKQYPNGHVALCDVSLRVQPGEIVSLLGTSGCGKSTLLRLVAGLETPTQGQVRLGEQPITGPNPAVGVIFQEPRLMPWLTVAQNVAFGLHALPAAKQTARTQAVLARVGLQDFAQALPRQLSGGMAQRVAIARALVTQPQLLLLDEPFSALDPFTRIRLQDELLTIWAYDRPTLIVVTHDIEEALVLSDRIVVLHGQPGQVQEIVTPNLPRPRRRTEEAFHHYKDHLLQLLSTDHAPVVAY